MFLSACSFLVCWFPLSFTTCFGLYGHLQVCRILNIFKDSASLPFFTWSHSAWVKLLYEVLLFVVYAIFGTVMCVFLLTCVLFLCCFPVAQE
jgi:hypothetical protein